MAQFGYGPALLSLEESGWHHGGNPVRTCSRHHQQAADGVETCPPPKYTRLYVLQQNIFGVPGFVSRPWHGGPWPWRPLLADDKVSEIQPPAVALGARPRAHRSSFLQPLLGPGTPSPGRRTEGGHQGSFVVRHNVLCTRRTQPSDARASILLIRVTAGALLHSRPRHRATSWRLQAQDRRSLAERLA